MNFRVASMCLLVVVLPVASGGATTIDLFESSQSITANPVANAAADSTPGGDMIGSERDLVVLWDSGFGDVRLSSNPYASTVLSHAQDGGVLLGERYAGVHELVYHIAVLGEPLLQLGP